MTAPHLGAPDRHDRTAPVVPDLPRISDYARHWAAEAPDREALVGAGERISYRDLSDHVDRIAAGLLASGVRRGDRVAMLSNPQPLCFAHFLAAASIGAIWVGVNPKYRSEEIAAVLTDSRPRLLFCFSVLESQVASLAGVVSSLEEPPELVSQGAAVPVPSQCWDDFLTNGSAAAGALESARSLVTADDAAAMIYTSGTTGRSKGALVPHAGFTRCGIVQASHWYGAESRKLCDLPINHIGGLGDICTSVLTAGGTVVFMEKFDPAAALRTVESERLTHLYWVPAQYLAAIATSEWKECDLSSLEWALWGGATASRSLLETLAAKVPRLGTSYGLTESSGSVAFTGSDDSLDTLTWSVGTVDPRYEVVLRRADVGDVQPGETGEIMIRGDHVTLGYFGRPDDTALAIDPGGWLHTGDLAQLDADGNLRLVGRLKEMYKSGGYNVHPREIEAVLDSHDAVSQAAVVGVPDSTWGEVGHAFVVTAGQDVPELDGFLRARLANFKIPKRIWVRESLPTLPIGKVDKAALRRIAVDQAD